MTRLKRERKESDVSDSEIGGHKAPSIKSGSTHKKNIQLENTYKLAPDHVYHFVPHKVQNVAQNVLEEILKDKEYDPTTVPALVKRIVEKTKERTKELKMLRHKIVVHAVVGERGEQSLKATSRCLWNDKFDSHTSAEYQNKHLFAVVTVYGIFFE